LAFQIVPTSAHIEREEKGEVLKNKYKYIKINDLILWKNDLFYLFNCFVSLYMVSCRHYFGMAEWKGLGRDCADKSGNWQLSALFYEGEPPLALAKPFHGGGEPSHQAM